MASIFFLSGVWSLSQETYSNIGGTIQPQKDYIPRGTLSHQLNQVNIKSMVLKRCWKGFGKVGANETESAGD